MVQGAHQAQQGASQVPAEPGVLLAPSLALKVGLQKSYLGWDGSCHVKTSAKALMDSIENPFVQMLVLQCPLLADVAWVGDGNCRPEQDEEAWEIDSLWGLSCLFETGAAALQQKMVWLPWALVELLSDEAEWHWMHLAWLGGGISAGMLVEMVRTQVHCLS